MLIHSLKDRWFFGFLPDLERRLLAAVWVSCCWADGPHRAEEPAAAAVEAEAEAAVAVAVVVVKLVVAPRCHVITN